MSIDTESTSVVLRAPESKYPHCALFHASLIKKKKRRKKSRYFDMQRTILHGRGFLKPHWRYEAPDPLL